MNTKTVLMLVVLSAGMLTGLTATTIQATPAFAEKEECEKNNDNNCNEVKDRGQSITQINNCEIEDGSSGDIPDNVASANTGNDNRFTCANNLVDPNTGDNSFNPP